VPALSAQHRAERDAQRAHSAPDAQRAGPLPLVGEPVDYQRQGTWQERRRSEALHRAGGNQHP
jgi:hypothetical protein